MNNAQSSKTNQYQCIPSHCMHWVCNMPCEYDGEEVLSCGEVGAYIPRNVVSGDSTGEGRIAFA